MTFEELLNKRPKTQAESMLCQAIAALSTQPQFSNMSPNQVFDHVQGTCQHWDEPDRELEVITEQDVGDVNEVSGREVVPENLKPWDGGPV